MTPTSAPEPGLFPDEPLPTGAQVPPETGGQEPRRPAAPDPDAEALRRAPDEWRVLPLADVLGKRPAPRYEAVGPATLGPLAGVILRAPEFRPPAADLGRPRGWRLASAPGPLRGSLPARLPEGAS